MASVTDALLGTVPRGPTLGGYIPGGRAGLDAFSALPGYEQNFVRDTGRLLTRSERETGVYDVTPQDEFDTWREGEWHFNTPVVPGLNPDGTPIDNMQDGLYTIAGNIIPFPPRRTLDLDATPDDRQAEAKKYLDQERRNRLRLVPKGGGAGYRAPVNPGGGIGSIALALAPLGYRLGQYLTSPLDEVSPYPEVPDYIGGQRAEDAARTGRRGYLEGIFPGGTPETLLPEQPSPYGSLTPISHTGGGVGGDEIPMAVDVMPVIPPPADFRSNMPWINPFEEPSDDLMIEDLMYNPPFVAVKELIPDITPERFDDFVTEAVLGIDIPEPPMESQVKQALTDYGRGEDAGELQAIAEMTYVDPVLNDEEMFFEKYLDPTRQEAIDITSQVESFSAIQEADQQRMEREAVQERADNKRRADAAAARQEQVRADNQRRAEESREAQDRARENRERQEAQAERARAEAERTQAADDRKSAARAQARADAAAQRERQATIQRQEDNRRRQATERAAANQRRAEQQREQAARAREAAARAQQQSRAQAAAAASRARSQAAARAANIAAAARRGGRSPGGAPGRPGGR